MKQTHGLVVAVCMTAVMVRSAWAVTLYDAAFRVRIIEEDGTPVTNAEVKASFPHLEDASLKEPFQERYTALTDTNGCCSFTGKCNDAIHWGVSKDGYYPTMGMKVEAINRVAGRIEPWNQLNEVQLRRIQHPVPCLGRYVGFWFDVLIPDIAQSYGFDLVESDWVAPFGKGITADFIFWMITEPVQVPSGYYERYRHATPETKAIFTLMFANPKDGIQGFIAPPNIGSVFRSPRMAPLDNYATNLTSACNADDVPCDNKQLAQNYIFRIRSQVDAQGNVTNALYGKIYGPICCSPNKKVQFNYLVNPLPNDRNLEFNLHRNLLKRLPQGEAPRDF